mmetsp:Transcript_9393/g.13008  ORF Transcript_9393/g.13008 Transcript_9393/m.13008 type:complete len:208 (+) Transcript_9393:141-764(+)
MIYLLRLAVFFGNYCRHNWGFQLANYRRSKTSLLRIRSLLRNLLLSTRNLVAVIREKLSSSQIVFTMMTLSQFVILMMLLLQILMRSFLFLHQNLLLLRRYQRNCLIILLLEVIKRRKPFPWITSLIWTTKKSRKLVALLHHHLPLRLKAMKQLSPPTTINLSTTPTVVVISNLNPRRLFLPILILGKFSHIPLLFIDNCFSFSIYE